MSDTSVTQTKSTPLVAEAGSAGALGGLRVALIHYWLNGYGGGEKVLEAIAELFPQADLFTLIATQSGIPPKLRNRHITTSFASRIPGVKRWHRHFLPLYPYALEQFDLSEYDLVISSEAGPAKGVIPSPDSCHICYCHSPMRYIWHMYHQYRRGVNPLSRALFSLTAHYARVWDLTTAARVDYFIANSSHVASRIHKYYRRESSVIYPPVDVSAGYISPRPEDYYLVVSRLVPYKRVDLAVEACNRLRRHLRIAGTGPEYKRLRRIAGPTVEFVGKLDHDSLRENYARCRALLFPGEEDFGIVPVEAQSFGRPVIAFDRGGARETVIGTSQDDLPGPEQSTGLFFDEQTTESLVQAMLTFETLENRFSPHFIQNKAERFSREKFFDGMRSFVTRKLEEHRRKFCPLNEGSSLSAVGSHT